MVAEIVDVTEWFPAGEEQVGTKPKQWLFEPGSRQRWLWKAVTSGRDDRGNPYRKGDDWSEFVASRLAVEIGIPCAAVELAVRHGEPGTIAKNFAVEDAELVLGNELLSGKFDGYGGGDGRWNDAYTLERVREVLTTVSPMPNSRFTDAWSDFAGYLTLDGLVGNSDRHDQNWGLLRTQDSAPVLAPTFDHASSLGFLLSDREREARLASRDASFQVEHWADRARTPFAGRPHPCELARDALLTVPPAVAADLLQRVARSVGVIETVVAEVPDSRMSEAAMAFAIRIVRHNGARMLLHPLRMVTP